MTADVDPAPANGFVVYEQWCGEYGYSAEAPEVWHKERPWSARVHWLWCLRECVPSWSAMPPSVDAGAAAFSIEPWEGGGSLGENMFGWSGAGMIRKPAIA